MDALEILEILGILDVLEALDNLESLDILEALDVLGILDILGVLLGGVGCLGCFDSFLVVYKIKRDELLFISCFE